LVLAQPTRDSTAALEQLQVSIPHWFSLNSYLHYLISCGLSFHPTLVLAQQATSAFGSLVTASSFHPTLVLAQPRIRSEHGPGITRFHPTLVLAQPHRRSPTVGQRPVSIPHWFSLNETDTTGTNPGILFPSHIGSRSTQRTCKCFSASCRFHPTLVLAQPIRPCVALFPAFPFPSHIGSRSTKIDP